MIFTQKLGQRACLDAVYAKADYRVLVVVKTWDQLDRLRALLTMLRLPVSPLHLVTGPVQLFQAVSAAKEVGRDNDKHDAGTTQRRLHFCWCVITISAGHAAGMLLASIF